MAVSRKIRFDLQVGDICQFDADVVAVKYAERLLGASFALARALQLGGEDIHRMLPQPNDMHLFQSGGRTRARAVLFYHVPMAEYADRVDENYSRHVLAGLAELAPDARHVVFNLHGVGLGLNPAAVLQGLVAGCVEAIQAETFPAALALVSVVDRNAHIISKLMPVLEQAVPGRIIEARLASPDERHPAGESAADFDVFISYKSEDSQFAQQVFEHLRAHGLNVFFSKESLPQLGSDEYHEQIDRAIERARHMVVVASAPAHLESQWVKYEWRLFLGEKLAGRKPGNLVTVTAGDLAIGDLPISLRHREVIPLAPGELDRLLEFLRRD